MPKGLPPYPFDDFDASKDPYEVLDQEGEGDNEVGGQEEDFPETLLRWPRSKTTVFDKIFKHGFHFLENKKEPIFL